MPMAGSRPGSDRAKCGALPTRHSWTSPPYAPTASVALAGDHASAVIGSPRGVMVKVATRRSVPVENTPTVEVLIGTAKRDPSPDTANGGACGERGSQQGRAAPSLVLRPKLRLPVRSHASSSPPIAAV